MPLDAPNSHPCAGMPLATPHPPTVQVPHSRGRFTASLRAVKQFAVARAAVACHRLLGDRDGGQCGILMYHRVTPRVPGVALPTWNVSPRRFRAQLAGLLSRGYRAWPLRQLLEHRRRGLPIPPGTFVVTFDDGYENVYREAWPILRELGIPATIFVATAYLDTEEPFPFDDWEAAGSSRVPRTSWRPLSRRQCEEMLASSLIDLGSHTHTHDDFRGRPEALRKDVAHSLEFLRAEFGLETATFAFPYGTRRLGFSGPLLSAAVREAGALCSLTTESQLVALNSDPFDWGRLTAHGHDTAATLAAKLRGWDRLAPLRRGQTPSRSSSFGEQAQEQYSAAPPTLDPPRAVGVTYEVY